MKIAKLIENTTVEGPGKRFAIWFQGCSLRCPGCINQELQDPTGGDEMLPEDIVALVKKSGLNKITILGGEPLDQRFSIQALIYQLKMHIKNCSIMLFTGYEEAVAKEKLGLVWPAVDVVISGPYDKTKPDKRKWIGSTNQKIHFKNPAHRDWAWPEKDGIEYEFSYDEKGAYQNGL